MGADNRPSRNTASDAARALMAHKLCHACGFALAPRGIDMRALQEWLGRCTFSTRSATELASDRFQDFWRGLSVASTSGLVLAIHVLRSLLMVVEFAGSVARSHFVSNFAPPIGTSSARTAWRLHKTANESSLNHLIRNR